MLKMYQDGESAPPTEEKKKKKKSIPLDLVCPPHVHTIARTDALSGR
jgi:hypothetical protein